MTTLSAQVRDWSEKAKRNTNLVMKQSARYLVDDLTGAGASGNAPGAGILPVVTGNLRNSLMASTAQMPPTREGEFAAPQTDFVINGWNPQTETTLWLGWQAVYARRINYGFQGTDSLGRTYNQYGRFFLETYAAQWQNYVDRAAREVGQ
jgi:hypothetical protein